MSHRRFQPLASELRPAPPRHEVFLRLAALPHCVFLDSALEHPTLGRYSFVAADPFDYLECGPRATASLEELETRLGAFAGRRMAALPPFQGGAAGLFGYDLGRQLESLPPPARDDFAVPSLAIGLYDVVVAFDHRQERAWIVSQGFPQTEPVGRRRRAQTRLDQFRELLDRPPGRPFRARAGEPGPDEKIPPGDLAPLRPVGRREGLASNFSRAEYLAAIGRAIEYIRAGDIFQVNLAQRLLYPAGEDSVSLYLRLRRCNPAPFAGYFDLGRFQVASASPERFLRLLDGQVEARPIKGTRPRTAGPEADLFCGDELRASEKDRAENVMIVDLLRNDLSRVCRPESVRVTELCQVERYAYVQHLVSAVRGRLGEGAGPIDLVRAAFPGGSITGAPKVRAMEIIAELEPTARGAYCGSLGYVGFDGAMDLSILIRTITAGRGWWQAPVGGGIVAQSVPQREYEETWDKAEGMLRALVRPA